MARSEIELEIHVFALTGTADCTVCGRLVSWQLRYPNLEIESLRCPTCRGTVDPHESSFVCELELRPKGGSPISKQTVFLDLGEGA